MALALSNKLEKKATNRDGAKSTEKERALLSSAATEEDKERTQIETDRNDVINSSWDQSNQLGGGNVVLPVVGEDILQANTF